MSYFRGGSATGIFIPHPLDGRGFLFYLFYYFWFTLDFSLFFFFFFFVGVVFYSLVGVFFGGFCCSLGLVGPLCYGLVCTALFLYWFTVGPLLIEGRV